MCNKDFTAIKTTQLYCSRKCFKKAYYLRKKQEAIEEEARLPKTPEYNCPFCHELYRLSFNPITDPLLYAVHQCPECGVTKQMLWDFRYNSQAISALVSSYVKAPLTEVCSTTITTITFVTA